MITQAQRIHQYGGPNVIVLEDVELPRPGPHQALIRVSAAGVGPWDALVRTGSSGLPQPLPLTLGADLAGMVLDVGDDVTHVAAGVEIYGATNARFVGAYARHAIVDVQRIARKPAALSFIEAGGLPVVAVTAWTMLFERGGLTRGRHVLVHGAGGNVGALAVQMARAAGAIVTALGSAADLAYLASIGADRAVDYGSGPFEQTLGPFDLIIDTIGGDLQQRSFPLLLPGGALISSVHAPNAEIAARLGVRAEFFIVDVSTRVLDRVSALLRERAIVPSVSRCLPFADARKAHELLAAPVSGTHGKIVLSMGI